MGHAARVASVVFFFFAIAFSAWNGARADDEIKNCFSVHGEARYGALAYKHVVIVTNRCEIELQCEVWTDVDPSPRQPLTVPPKGTGEVIVRAVSPARAFKAYGECEKR